ncbi:aspartic peptidase domain-containing protein [Lasiosphaeris hirsuta]|uniref:Aspartic peptidase domain-containing protein n=1 Tax=Lasiosphaeris hirsuta TaxID=260670 RepID=A0AA40AYW8_9PEZI|nr:aspartic peptidase domain-containing protein [Lasiosphaeris hirsuta]
MGSLKYRCAVLAALVGTLIRGAGAGEVFQVPFTTDLTNDGSDPDLLPPATYGPDGPWQAVSMMLGSYQRPNRSIDFNGGPRVPMWPTDSIILQISEKAAGGKYDIHNGTASEPWYEFGNNGNNTAQLADYYANQTSEGVCVFDSVTLLNMRFDGAIYANANASIYAMNTTKVTLRDGTTYTPVVGNLALGRPIEFFLGTSILEQMKDDGLIASSSFGLHLGSVPLKQRGSLIFGGYDESRVIGPIAVFKWDDIGDPNIFLIDLNIGVETGRWPFNTTEIPSLWEKTTDEAGIAIAEYYGGKDGYIQAYPNAAVPGIYLPTPICANAAKHLPVTMDNRTGYYLWNTEDPTYWSIVNSGAYLAFTFADSSATNVTIKVPMTLLNLTLEAPIMPTPTPYFPCHDRAENVSYWELGRAFLQAAYFGINLDTNMTYLAQAPGPNMDQSIVRTLKPGETTLVSKPVSSFVDSWRGEWLALESDTPGGSSSTSKRGISGGAIAGIVVGVVVGVALLAAAGWFVWRKRNPQAKLPLNPVELHTGPQNRGAPKPYSEKDIKEVGDNFVHEAANSPIQEMESPAPRTLNEAPGSPGVYEMPADPYVAMDRRDRGERLSLL